MSKRKHGKKRCRVAGRKPQPKAAARAKAEAPFKGREAFDEKHPLVVAFRTNTINRTQYQAGDELRTICALLVRSGRDSTDIQPPTGGRTSADGWFTDAITDARKKWLRIRERMGGAKSANWIICLKVCGEGWELPHAILAAGIPCHEDGRRKRFQEALNALAGIKEGKRALRASTKLKPPKRWLQRLCAGCSCSLLKTPDGVGVSIFEHARAKIVLCAECTKAEPTRLAKHGEDILFAIYRQNLFLPPIVEPEERPTHKAKHGAQSEKESGWKSRHKGYATMRAA